MVDFMDDKQLLGELKRGNNAAFEFLFKSYYPRLRGYAIRFIEDEETVRDIIQECFLRFWERREMLSAFSLTSLLFSMVRNGCLNYLKHRSIVEKYRVEYLAKVDGEERLYYADFMQDAEHKLLYKELQEQIALVLNQLPDRSREIFFVKPFQGIEEQRNRRKTTNIYHSSRKAYSKGFAIFLPAFQRTLSGGSVYSDIGMADDGAEIINALFGYIKNKKQESFFLLFLFQRLGKRNMGCYIL